MECGPDNCPIGVTLSPAERKAQRKPRAEKLYKQGFTMEQIAMLLGVTQKTVSKDLDGVYTQGINLSRPKGGRPKGSNRGKYKSDPETRARAASLFLDEGKTRNQVVTETGLPEFAVRSAVEREIGRREAEPMITPDMLSMTAQEKLDAAGRAQKQRLEAEFHDRVNQRVREFLEETILPQHRKEQAQAQQIMRARKGIMDKTSFRLIWSALHPDSRKSISDRKLAEAFDVFSRLEKLLLDEKQSPTDYQKLPRTMAEWDQMREAARKTKRPSGNSSLRPR